MYHSNGFLINTRIYNSPARIKAIPPTISYFQDISRTTNNTSVGILCINNAPSVCQKLNSEEKTSNDINAKKNMNIMDIILGAQYTNLLIFFFNMLFHIRFKYLKLFVSEVKSRLPELHLIPVKRSMTQSLTDKLKYTLNTVSS